MAIPKVFVSFDYDNDKHYKHLLTALSENTRFNFKFNDNSSNEINSNSISVVKAALSRKINESDKVLVIVGKEANKRHKDYLQIGKKNWQNYEIAKAKELGKKLIGVKIDRLNESPDELLGSGAKWAMSFSVDSIIDALE